MADDFVWLSLRWFEKTSNGILSFIFFSSFCVSIWFCFNCSFNYEKIFYYSLNFKLWSSAIFSISYLKFTTSLSKLAIKFDLLSIYATRSLTYFYEFTRTSDNSSTFYCSSYRNSKIRICTCWFSLIFASNSSSVTFNFVDTCSIWLILVVVPHIDQLDFDSVETDYRLSTLFTSL